MSFLARLDRRARRLERRSSQSRLPPQPSPLADWAFDYLFAYFPLPPSPFHLWLASELDTLPTRRGQRLNVLAPRGAAKSSWATFAYPLCAAAHETEPYLLLTSDTKGQAEKYLDSIRIEIETNELLHRDYPRLRIRSARQDRLTLTSGMMIEALGTGAKLRGRKNRQHRPTAVIIDDPQNKDHIVSALQRERTWDWLTRDVLHAGGPTTNFIVLGTALHQDAIVCRLQKTAGWRSRVWRSLEPWPDRMDLWREWRDLLHDHDRPDPEGRALAFYEEHRADMDAGAGVLWPEREPLYDLMMAWASSGDAAFASEKQNDPVDPEACEWAAEHFDWPGLWIDEWPKELEVRVLAIDPSKGADAKRGDYSAIVLYGRTKEGLEYVEADLARRSVDVICAEAARRARAFRPDRIVCEANSFQGLMLAPLKDALRREGVDAHLQGVSNAVPKAVRIRRLTGPIVQRKFRFKARSPGTALLVQQLRDFPNGAHDDGPDCLELARRVAVELYNGRAGR